ncbi:MAG: hypothetical protein ACR2KM_02810, partial [Gemmatimonadaceae bacterium]
PGIQLRAIEREVLLLSTRLPGTVHGDPVDRMLLATAQLYNLPVVTAEGLIIDYAKVAPGTPVVDIRSADC